jgi:hypothetical protein
MANPRVSVLLAAVILSGCHITTRVVGGAPDGASSPSQADSGATPPPASADAGPVVSGRDAASADRASGATADAAAPAVSPDAAVVRDAASPTDVSIPASGKGIIHSSQYATWSIYDVASYRAHQANMDEVMDILDRAIPAIQARMQQPFKFPIKVSITKGGCCGGFTGGGEVGYNDGDFTDGFGMYWIRGVIIGEVVNAVVGSVSSGWPSDWWVNSVWYFPGFAVVDVMKEVVPDHWQEWQTKEKYDQFPVSVLFEQLRSEQGWKLYQDLWNGMRADQLDLSQIGGMNPNDLLTNYVLAYFGVAAGSNIADRFVAAKVNGADPNVVQAIMDARDKLVTSGQPRDSQAWQTFRSGDYQAAVQGL